jgi:hypothetical protein
MAIDIEARFFGPQEGCMNDIPWQGRSHWLRLFCVWVGRDLPSITADNMLIKYHCQPVDLTYPSFSKGIQLPREIRTDVGSRTRRFPR